MKGFEFYTPRVNRVVNSRFLLCKALAAALTVQEAETLLEKMPIGTYLIRDSNKLERCYALSVKEDGRVQHLLVEITK